MTRALWLFSVGSFGDTKRVIGPLTHKEPKRIGEVRAALQPRDYRVFQGVIRKHQWPFWSRVLFHAFGGRFGDHRDWPVIEAWAEEIAFAVMAADSTRIVSRTGSRASSGCGRTHQGRSWWAGHREGGQHP